MDAEFDDHLNTAKNLGYELLNSASDMQDRRQKQELLIERVRQRMDIMSNAKNEAEQRNRELEQRLQETTDEAWRDKTRLQSELEDEKARAERAIERLRVDHDGYVSQRKNEHERAVAELRTQLADERSNTARILSEHESLQRAFDMLSSSVRKFTLGIRDQNDDMGALLTLVATRPGSEFPAIEDLSANVPEVTYENEGSSENDGAESNAEKSEVQENEVHLNEEANEGDGHKNDADEQTLDDEMEREMAEEINRVVSFNRA